jgi:hypothetical protein
MRALFALLALLLVTLSVGLSADAPVRPKTILVIRHAEKPASGPDLSPQGFERAEALPALFQKSDSRPEPFPTPDFIFATESSSSPDKSKRPVETVQPLAKKLGLDIDDKVKNDHFTKVADKLLNDKKYDGKTVLVCWHHGKIPHLLSALGVTPQPDDVPPGVFNQVWVVTFDAAGKAKLEERPQLLLPSDKEKK